MWSGLITINIGLVSLDENVKDLKEGDCDTRVSYRVEEDKEMNFIKVKSYIKT